MKRASSPPTRTPTRRCSPRARATCRRCRRERASWATAGCPRSASIAPAGSLLFDAHLPFDMSFYRAYRFPWSGRPASPPAVLANLNNTGEETIVHASWNGATDVAAWRVLAGKQPGSLTAQATIAATGFESSTTLPKKYPYVGGPGARLGRPRARRLARRCRRSATPPRSRAPEGRDEGWSERRSVGRLGLCLCVVAAWSSWRGARRRLWRSSCSSFAAAPRHRQRGSPGRPAALAWRSVAFFSSAGLQSSLEGFGRSPYQALRRAVVPSSRPARSLAGDAPGDEHA